MDKMQNLFGESYNVMPKRKPKPQDPNKISWENAFQKWSDNMALDEKNYSHYGACGYGVICDYCEDNGYGRPCVRALNSMCREKFLSIDYSDKSEGSFKKWFDGGK